MVSRWVVEVRDRLRGRVPTPEADARLLVAHAVGVEPSRMICAVPTDDAYARLTQLVNQRAAGVPVQHLTGRAPFRHLMLTVGRGVFVPRPETETMVGWCLDALADRDGLTVVDLCTGSGAIALSLATELAERAAAVHAVELSPEAARYAHANCAGSMVNVHEGDAVTALGELDGTVDLVVTNPPYIPLEAWESVPADVRDYDPHLALFSGDDGLDLIRRLAGTAARLLRGGGLVAVEHADVQGSAVVDIFARSGEWVEVRDHQDLSGRPRFTTARRNWGRIER